MKKTSKKWRWNPVKALVNLAIAECIFTVAWIVFLLVKLPQAFYL